MCQVFVKAMYVRYLIYSREQSYEIFTMILSILWKTTLVHQEASWPEVAWLGSYTGKTWRVLALNPGSMTS